MKEFTTSERLKQIMHERGLTQNDILKLCDPYAKEYHVKFGKSILSQYISGTIEPGQWKLTILAKGLGVSETWLMGYASDDEENSTDELRERLRTQPGMRVLFDATKNATPEELEQAVRIIKALKGDR